MILWTDGSCLGNPGPGGWAVFSEYDTARSGGQKLTTSNQMELRAIIEALKWATEEQVILIIFSDSQWAINTIDGTWQVHKYPYPEEIDYAKHLVRDLREAGYRIKLEWVKGHALSPQNHRADAIARREADYARGT
jgi:ribonuclease HI